MNIFRHAIPDSAPLDIISWAEANVKVNGGKTSFSAARTPQIIEPMRAMAHDPGLRIGTLIKPVQIGGSTAGEVLATWWCAFGSGLFFFYWEDDQKAENRFKDRILPPIQSCKDVRFSGTRYETTVGEVRLVNITMRCLGSYTETNLDSDSVGLMILEELHSWKPGHLAKARARQTQFWNAKAFDISNASEIGDQLHSAYEDGTMEEWEVLCPGCKKYHVMRTRWEDRNPELGGLRYDSDGCKMDNGRFNYNKLEKTVRFQMPCGYVVRDNPVERRSLTGKYSAPRNEGAHLSHRSWNFEAVSCDSIRWLDIIREKHAALRALKAGDSEPWRRYITERECRFYGPESIPFSGQIIVNTSLIKSRAGLAGRAARFWFADKQKGYAHKGELIHYWLVIRDVMPNGDSQLVFEGLVQTDADLLARLEEHECVMQSGAVDCGWDRVNVLQFCYRNGANAQTTSAQNKLFYHKEDKAYRIYSEPEGLHKQLKVPPKFNYLQRMNAGKIDYYPHPEEPLHWSIHRVGSIKLLFFLRGHKQLVERAGGTDFIKWEVPGDVSEDYKKQLESWEFSTKKNPNTNLVEEICKQRLPADHLAMCEAGIANLMAMAPHPDYPHLSILSVRLAQMGIVPEHEQEKKTEEK